MLLSLTTNLVNVDMKNFHQEENKQPIQINFEKVSPLKLSKR